MEKKKREKKKRKKNAQTLARSIKPSITRITWNVQTEITALGIDTLLLIRTRIFLLAFINI